jgi:BNR/Asp-box repeat
MEGKTFIATTGKGLARALENASGRWEVETLLPGVDVRCLAADPLDNETLYAGTQGSGVMRSDDGGRTWRPSGLPGCVVKALAVSPVRRGVVYAGTRPARLFVSDDGGATWTELSGFRRIPWKWLWLSPAEKPFVGYVQAIALSPTDPRHIAVGIEFGATVLSRDGGKTWTRHRKGALRDCHSLISHASRGDWLYESGGSGAGNAFSSDGGRTWSSVKGLDRRYGWAVAADPERPEVWYLSASTGAFKAHSEGNAEAFIFRSSGKVWERLQAGPQGPLSYMPYALLTEPGSAGRIYAGLSNGDVRRSDDYGDHWRRLPFNLGRIERALVMLKGAR